ncbi:ABC transporter permease [Halomarina ordinaria]|uniref:ABC transporter permease n=1 Tax=Halomarina ordinaria TaxID=3033939 RepID=A0ABD5UDQ7_9EURY|nr:ABC transporter permease [Halomarina sp. PSRA2]
MSPSGLTGFRSLLRREILRFVRRPRNTFLPPAITNVLYFAVFGVILGSRLSGVSGDFGYIEFVLPGLVVLGVVSNAFENASFSIFHGRWNEYINETLTSPLSYTAMVFAYVLSSSLRGLLVGALVYAIGYLFAPVVPARPLYLLGFAVVIPVLFSGLGVIGGLWARDFDYLTVLTQFILRPLVFFGGVFYSLSVLPEPYFTLSLLDPLVYMVDGMRYGVLGYSELDPNLSLAVLTALALAVLAVDVALFKRGYGLVD